MNMRECKNLKPGAIVRPAYATSNADCRGIVLHKEHVEQEHYANILGSKKQERYDLYIHWLKAPRYPNAAPNPRKQQCWEVVLVQDVK